MVKHLRRKRHDCKHNASSPSETLWKIRAFAPLVHYCPLLSIVHCPLKRLIREAWL